MGVSAANNKLREQVEVAVDVYPPLEVLHKDFFISIIFNCILFFYQLFGSLTHLILNTAQFLVQPEDYRCQNEK